MLDGLTKLRDMRCAETHDEALRERGRVVTSEGRGRDEIFLNGQAGQG